MKRTPWLFSVFLVFTISTPIFSQIDFEKIYESVDNTYHREFPAKILIDGYIPQNPKLGKTDLTLYTAFAGSYLNKSEISSLKSFRGLFALRSYPSSWGIGYAFGKWKKGMDYFPSSTHFFLSEGDGGGREIRTSSEMNLPKDWVRISGPGIKSSVITDIVKAKIADSARLSSSEFQENWIRDLLKTFFTSLELNDFEQFKSVFLEENQTIVEEPGVDPLTYDLKTFYTGLRKFGLSQLKMGFQVYINVYFSESSARIQKMHSGATLVELKFDTSSDYFSFVLVDNGVNYKILALRNDLDQE